MKKTIFTLGVFGAFILSFGYFTTSGCSSDKPDTDTVKTGGVEMGLPTSYAFLPGDINEMTQNAADTFSWKTFIAMNWPADVNSCSADTTKNILSGTGPVVWETYLSSDQIFVDTGSHPASWCANSNPVTAMAHVPTEVQELAKKTGVYRFIHMNAKAPSIDGIDQASGGPLVDQHGRFARYEIRVNMDEYNYIHENNLWSKKGQRDYIAAGDTFYFPGGPTRYGPAGAMEFKAAWKVLGPGDDSTKFYTIRAIVFNDAQGAPSPGPNPVTLGLVGLHIAHKTATQSMWVWSTFEHVDNLTTSFYNPASNQIPNQPITGSPDELDSITGQPLHLPTQVTRVNALEDPALPGINTYYQNLLNGSVWANYELIGTQWLFFEDVTPEFLANSVQETYLQGPHPDSVGFDYQPHSTDDYYFHHPEYHPFSVWTSSSCLACHYTAKAQAIHSDFSFIMGNAQ